MKNEIKN